jgi:hypothetical protein
MLLEVIHIPQRTLVIARQLGNPLLSQGRARGQQRQAQKYGRQGEGEGLHKAIIG